MDTLVTMCSWRRFATITRPAVAQVSILRMAVIGWHNRSSTMSRLLLATPMFKAVWTSPLKPYPAIDSNGRRSIAQMLAAASVIVFLSCVVGMPFVTNTIIAPLPDLSTLGHLWSLVVLVPVIFLNVYTFLQLKHVAYSRSLPCCCTMPIFFQRAKFRPAWFLRNKNTRSASFGDVFFSSFSITRAFSELELDATISISTSRSLVGAKFVLCLNEICPDSCSNKVFPQCTWWVKHVFLCEDRPPFLLTHSWPLV